MSIGDDLATGRRDTLPAGDRPRELAPMDLDPTTIDAIEVAGDAWGTATVGELFERHEGLGLVVLHHGRLAHQRYADDSLADRRNLCFSVTKSFTGTLAAAAVGAGRLARSRSVGDVLPELAATGFADATVGDLADMTASIAYDEDYDEATAPSDQAGWRGFGDYMVAIDVTPEPAGAAGAGVQTEDPPRTLRALLRAIGPGTRPHGEAFAYATPVSDTLGWVLERTDGRDGADHLLADLWSHVGSEHGARLSRDRAGTALMGAGLAMTTRDLARFGALLADGGRTPDGTPVLDAGVLEAIRDGGDPDVFARGGHYDYLAGYSYRDQWWLPGGASRPLSAWGIFGQVLWVDPDAGVVVAYHCGGPLASDARRDLEQDALCRALVEASSAWG